jgi:tRNA (guanine37-N1)-methyltransferase
MKITVLSLFPEILRGFFESSIMKRAVEKGLVEYELVDIRDYAIDKHRKCDDEVYGGGAGMLMLAGPLGRALEAAGSRRAEEGSGPEAGTDAAADGGSPAMEGESAAEVRTVFLTPSGRLLNQAYAHELAREERLVLICGRYEGIDQRIVDRYVDDEVSIGDYVLSSGEVAALVLVDAVYRLIPGVIAGESLDEESFSGGQGAVDGAPAAALLEYPQYTRPADYDTLRVPEVLTSGHHAKIVRWRLKEQLRKTLAYRPELLATGSLPKEALDLLREIASEGGIHGPHQETPGDTTQAGR